MRTPLDPRPCRSFAEAFFDRAKRQLEEAEHLLRIDTAYFRMKDKFIPSPAQANRANPS
jgi:hypothetical protein